jgi:large subunit ribosomal protein L32
MTPLPKRRLSTRRQTQRAKGLKKLVFAKTFTCKNCGALVLPHHVCAKCGYYGGKLIINIKTKTKKEK